MPYDPARLRRRTWDNPNDLAQELYVILTSQRSEAEATAAPKPPARPVANATRPRPVPIRSFRQTPTPAPPPEPNPREEEEAVARREEVIQGSASLTWLRNKVAASTLAESRARPPAYGIFAGDSSQDATSSARLPSAEAEETEVASQAPPTRSATSAPTPPPAGPEAPTPPTRSDPVARRQERAVREVSYESTRVAASAAEAGESGYADDRATASSSRSKGVVQSRAPEMPPRGKKPDDATTPRFATLSLDTATAAPAAYKRRDGEEYRAKPTDIPFTTNARILGLIDAAGIPGCVQADQGYTPGKGKGYFLDFDGTTATYYDNEPTDVYNFSVIPLSGLTQAIFLLLGAHWFAVPVGVAMCHAVVTQSITACTGTDPGDGKIQFYTMQGGLMEPSGDPLPVDNWFLATAAVGKHCTVTAIDGGIGLEVLDCDP